MEGKKSNKTTTKTARTFGNRARPNNEEKTISTYVGDSILSTKKTFYGEKLTREIFYDQKGNMIRVNEYSDIKREFDIKNNYNKFGDLIEVQVYEKGKLICDINYAIEYW